MEYIPFDHVGKELRGGMERIVASTRIPSPSVDYSDSKSAVKIQAKQSSLQLATGIHEI